MNNTSTRRTKAAAILNILIILEAVVGTVLMLFFRDGDALLASSGVENLKYFTVLSNEFCGLVAVWTLILAVRRKAPPMLLKLMAAAAVGLTFLIVAGFLGLLYGHRFMYKNANLFFHLILPLTAMAEYVLLPVPKGGVPFKWTFCTMIPVFLYGSVYLTNNLVNGTGEWPDTNDFYGFLNWGLPVGIVIFAGIMLAVWGIACALRAAQGRISRKGCEES